MKLYQEKISSLLKNDFVPLEETKEGKLLGGFGSIIGVESLAGRTRNNCACGSNNCTCRKDNCNCPHPNPQDPAMNNCNCPTDGASVNNCDCKPPTTTQKPTTPKPNGGTNMASLSFLF